MEDHDIIELYFARSENAIEETDKKYRRYLLKIAQNILMDILDSEECLSDTYLRAWESIPPERPNRFAIWLGKITRNLSVSRIRYKAAKKRSDGQFSLALSELDEVIPTRETTEETVELKLLADAIERFLYSQNEEKRAVFLKRYWQLMPVSKIAEQLHCSEARIHSMLHRLRQSLHEFLMKEGFFQ